jgi:hypothetical protein
MVNFSRHCPLLSDLLSTDKLGVWRARLSRGACYLQRLPRQRETGPPFFGPARNQFPKSDLRTMNEALVTVYTPLGLGSSQAFGAYS